MRTPTPSALPARAHALRRATPALVTASLIAATIAAAPAAAAPAATGTVTIGSKPVALTQPTDPGMGRLTPTADAATNGMFGPALAFPVLPMHATLTRQGHLVSFGTPVNTVEQAGIDFDDWDIATGAHSDVAAQHGYDSFCNAAVTLQDGRILMVSGQLSDGRDADMMSMLYDPVTKSQEMGANLAYQRWYVTALRLTDGRILLLGGTAAGNTGAYTTPNDQTKVAYTPEIGTGTGAWRQLTGAASPGLFGAFDNHWWYPRAFNAPTGGVVGISGDAVWRLDPDGDGSVHQVATLPYDPKVSGSQVMYAPGKILVAGGGQVNNTEEAAATNRAVVLDVTSATPTVHSTQSMHDGRNWLNLTVLPTGEVFADGGTAMGTDAGDANAMRQSEIWNPRTGAWRLAASAQRTRTYHSTALMLPSGAVFTGGGGNPGPVDNFDAELYYPAYLFTKTASGHVQWASRPSITAISGSATYGGTVSLKTGSGHTITSAALIPVASVTHSQNTDQRRIPLTVHRHGSTVTAKLPSSVTEMPPGDYELTVTDSHGVPSAAQILTIRSGAAGRVTIAEHHSTSTAAKSAGPAAPATKHLAVGSAVALVAHGSERVARRSSSVALASVTSHSGASTRRAASWIVHRATGSYHGYAFESASRRGWYLAAPADGTGTATLLKRSATGFASRTAFTVVRGPAGHDWALRMSAKATSSLRTTGSHLVVGAVSESRSALAAATFSVGTGLTRR